METSKLGSPTVVGVLRATQTDERRTPLIPAGVAKLVAKNVRVLIESGTGSGSFHSDEDYSRAGATVVPTGAEVVQQADVLVMLNRPTDEVTRSLRSGQVAIGPFSPMINHDLGRQFAERQVSAMSLDMVPRITRAQAIDILSSQATIAGYKAVLIAANHSPRLFPMLMTAAGTIPPARVLIIGAGVAGLQAIATARRLGAVVEAYDTRPIVKEQVESLGATFVTIDTGGATTGERGGYAQEATADVLSRQQAGLTAAVARADVVITTAAVPGKPAPRLITADAVAQMQPGSVIVDLAAETGGNCELTRKGEIVEHNGRTIVGLTNLPSMVPFHASAMLSRNLLNLFDLMIDKQGTLSLNMSDEVITGMLITHQGAVVHPMVRDAMGITGAAQASAVNASAAALPIETPALENQTETPGPQAE